MCIELFWSSEGIPLSTPPSILGLKEWSFKQLIHNCYNNRVVVPFGSNAMSFWELSRDYKEFQTLVSVLELLYILTDMTFLHFMYFKTVMRLKLASVLSLLHSRLEWNQLNRHIAIQNFLISDNYWRKAKTPFHQLINKVFIDVGTEFLYLYFLITQVIQWAGPIFNCFGFGYGQIWY